MSNKLYLKCGTVLMLASVALSSGAPLVAMAADSNEATPVVKVDKKGEKKQASKVTTIKASEFDTKWDFSGDFIPYTEGLTPMPVRFVDMTNKADEYQLHGEIDVKDFAKDSKGKKGTLLITAENMKSTDFKATDDKGNELKVKETAVGYMVDFDLGKGIETINLDLNLSELNDELIDGSLLDDKMPKITMHNSIDGKVVGQQVLVTIATVSDENSETVKEFSKIESADLQETLNVSRFGVYQDPSKPVDPGKPDPGKPDPGKPVDPGKPDPGKPVEPVTPVDPGKPDPGKPEPTKPITKPNEVKPTTPQKEVWAPKDRNYKLNDKEEIFVNKSLYGVNDSLEGYVTEIKSEYVYVRENDQTEKDLKSSDLKQRPLYYKNVELLLKENSNDVQVMTLKEAQERGYQATTDVNDNKIEKVSTAEEGSYVVTLEKDGVKKDIKATVSKDGNGKLNVIGNPNDKASGDVQTNVELQSNKTGLIAGVLATLGLGSLVGFGVTRRNKK